MDPRFYFGRILVLLGVLLVAAGLIMMYIGKIPFIGRFPGDITVHGKGWSFYFPIVTCLILSLIITLLLNLFLRR